MLASGENLSRLRLQEMLAAMRGRRVLVFGDVMLDCFIRGQVERISPEAPVPVVSVRERLSLPGGAANVVRNLVALGARPEIVALLGDDAEGELLRRELAQAGCETSGLVVEKGRRTSVKTRIVAHQQQVVRFDEESCGPCGPEAEAGLASALSEACGRVDGVIVSDYGKGVIAARLFDLLVGETRRRQLLLALDPKVVNYPLYHDVDLVTPNTQEAGQACGFAVTSENIEAAGVRIRERFQCRSLVITRGEDGMAVFPAAGPPLLLPTQAREVFDVTGAGDTVIAAMTLALLNPGTRRLSEAALLANLAAGVVVGKRGTATASAAEIMTCAELSDVRAHAART